MGKLEESVYRNSYRGAILKVTNKEAKFEANKGKNYCNETIDLQDIPLEHFPYLRNFLKETQYLEMKFDTKNHLFHASLYELKRETRANNKSVEVKNLLCEEIGLHFSIMFKTLEKYLMQREPNLEEVVIKASQMEMYLQVFGGNKLCGIFYDVMDGRSVFYREINVCNLELQNYPYLSEYLSYGKNLSICFSKERGFMVSVFYREREIKKVNDDREPFHKVILENAEGMSIQECLETLESHLENNASLVRSISKEA